MNLASQIESLLFVSAKPLTLKKLAEICEVKEGEVSEAVNNLQERYKKEESGLQIIKSGQNVSLSTSPANADIARAYLKDELTGELTRPSLETLTIIAYRGPITKLDLEQIRGVNCSLILRNLLMRGLIEAEEGAAGQPLYNLSFDFLRFLGVSDTTELPDYEKLHSSDLLDKLLNPNP